MSHGGDRIAEVLQRQGVKTLFTLCGGHISPILVGAKALGIRVIDTRHEVDAVFAADATARLTGVPGVAAVTAGPGLTNTITAVKNAQMAQSPVVILGGATATVLKGRGSLQDIDQQALMAPHVKWQGSARRVRELAPLLETAFARRARGFRGRSSSSARSIFSTRRRRRASGTAWLRNRRSRGRSRRRSASGSSAGTSRATSTASSTGPDERLRSPRRCRRAPRRAAGRCAAPPRRWRAPTGRCSSSAPRRCCTRSPPPSCGARSSSSGCRSTSPAWRAGCSARAHPLLRRHKRREALREADCVVLAGVPSDFRLDYGRHVGRRATLIAANRSADDLEKNRRPQIGALADPALFLAELADEAAGLHARWREWGEQLAARDAEREQEIAAQAAIEPVQAAERCRRPQSAAPAARARRLPRRRCGPGRRRRRLRRHGVLHRARPLALRLARSGRLRHARASAAASRSAPRSRGPTRRSGSSTATARSPTA